MFVERQPVRHRVMFLANLLTSGAIRKIMIENHIETYFHLAFRVDIIDDNSRIKTFRIEKNENISIEPYTTRTDSQFMNVDIGEDRLTMNILLTQTRLAIGKRHFYLYRFDSWTCADFIKEILHVHGLLTSELKTFVYQNTDIIQNEIPEQIRNRLHCITDILRLIGHVRNL
jgi:hypothetical protein